MDGGAAIPYCWVNIRGVLTLSRSRARPAATPYHHGDLRNHLLAVAFDILKDGGMAALSLREVAREAGVSHQAPYHHFPSRAHLLAALAEQGFEQLGTEVAAAQATVTPLDEKAYVTAVHYVLFAARNPERFKLMFGSEIGARTQYPALAAAASRVFELLVAPLGAKVTPGVGAPPPLALACWSTVHGLAALVVDGQVRLEGKAVEKAARDVALILWQGVKGSLSRS